MVSVAIDGMWRAQEWVTDALGNRAVRERGRPFGRPLQRDESELRLCLSGDESQARETAEMLSRRIRLPLRVQTAPQRTNPLARRLITWTAMGSMSTIVVLVPCSFQTKA